MAEGSRNRAHREFQPVFDLPSMGLWRHPLDEVTRRAAASVCGPSISGPCDLSKLLDVQPEDTVVGGTRIFSIQPRERAVCLLTIRIRPEGLFQAHPESGPYIAIPNFIVPPAATAANGTRCLALNGTHDHVAVVTAATASSQTMTAMIHRR